MSLAALLYILAAVAFLLVTIDVTALGSVALLPVGLLLVAAGLAASALGDRRVG